MTLIARAAQYLLAAGIASACGKPESQRAIDRKCALPFRPQYAADSALSVCLPSGFVVAPSHGGGAVRWERGDVQASDRAWLSITIDHSDAPVGAWPPHLASSPDCKVDCMTADSVVQHIDTSDVRRIVSETGLATGGLAGFQHQPLLFAGWILPAGGRVWVNGFATRGATLDTLRAALATVTLRAM
jgi:hypothetical protein